MSSLQAVGITHLQFRLSKFCPCDATVPIKTSMSSDNPKDTFAPFY
ncbi:hypothetical protein SLEP1_g35288 [Rubroshorea leprosula]|uniref:Uncharacterized protein n=1 Tax=Rubroshorea leprosula TaxID=152421 RepID=A0AAV5KMY3_9ROSI|nr:hypothetical protein SLEP1_g35288 [Rubroshorea leprosula]